MMLKKVEKGGKGAVAPFLSAVSSRFFFFRVRVFWISQTRLSRNQTGEKKRYIRVQTKTDTSGRGFYFNWGTKRRIKMTEVQLENWLCNRRSNESGNHILRKKNQDLRSNRTWSLVTAKRPSEKTKQKMHEITHTITRPKMINDTYWSALTEASSNMWRSSWEELKRKNKES